MTDRGAPPLAMERVGSHRIFGVTIPSDLSVSAHVEALLNAEAPSIYALRLLREHGLPDPALKIVTKATTINLILYAGPAWSGYANASDKGRTHRFIFKNVLMYPIRSDIGFYPINKDNNTRRAGCSLC